MIYYSKEKKELIIPSGFAAGIGGDTDVAYNDGLIDGMAQQKAKMTQLNISENGDYEREDGYSGVYVNVSPHLTTLTATKNGTFDPPAGYNGFDKVYVNVPSAGELKLRADLKLWFTEDVILPAPGTQEDKNWFYLDIDNAYKNFFGTGKYGLDGVTLYDAAVRGLTIPKEVLLHLNVWIIVNGQYTNGGGGTVGYAFYGPTIDLSSFLAGKVEIRGVQYYQ